MEPLSGSGCSVQFGGSFDFGGGLGFGLGFGLGAGTGLRAAGFGPALDLAAVGLGFGFGFGVGLGLGVGLVPTCTTGAAVARPGDSWSCRIRTEGGVCGALAGIISSNLS